MQKTLAIIAAGVVAAGVLGGCTSPPTPPAEKGALHLSSTAFADDGLIPINYSCAGAGVSPPLAWHGVAPTGTVAWALVVSDTSVTPQPFVHWVITGIATSTRALATGAVPSGSVVGPNSADTRSYVGLCPPAGSMHRYRFTVYALRSKVAVSGTDTVGNALPKIAAATISSVSLSGTFAR